MTDKREDWSGLREQAEKQTAAYERMLDIGEGVGGLGVKHPDMFEDMLAWDQISENKHADTVLTLLDVIDGLERHRAKREALLARIRSFASEVER